MSKIKIFLPFITALIIIFFILNKFGQEQIIETFKTGNIKLTVISLILFPLTLLFLAKRWHTILREYNINISYKETLSYYLGSVPISKISPSNSGDLVRALYLKDQMSLSANIGIVILENLLDILSLLFLVIIGSLFLQKILLALIALLAILIILCLIIFSSKIKITNKKWNVRIQNLISVKEKIFSNTRLFILLSIFSIIPWVIIIICIKLFFLSYGINIPFLIIFSIQPIAIFLGLIPVTFSGIGVRETAMLFLYAPYAKESVILATGLTYSAAAAIYLPLICLPFLIKTLKKISYAKR